VRIVLRGNPAYQVDQITADEAQALRAWYGHSSSEEQDAIALAVIRRAKIRDGWIECDCTPGDFKPLLAPQQQERTFTLRRFTPADGDPHARVDRPNHTETCPFHVDRDFEPSSQVLLQPLTGNTKRPDPRPIMRQELRTVRPGTDSD